MTGNTAPRTSATPRARGADTDGARQEPAYPRPVEDEARLDALRRLRVLDTPAEERFDRIARIAAKLFALPLARITFVDQHRTWVKARAGGEPSGVQEAPREISICAHAIMGENPLVVPDLTADPRFAKLPYVSGPPGIRFYAGAPITLSGGFRVGSVCVLDHHPHSDFSESDAAALADLAAIVANELELHRRVADRDARLRIAGEEIALANSAKRRFIARVSEELSAPLNAVAGIGRVIESQNQGPGGVAQYAEYAGYLCDAAQRLRDLVARILANAESDRLTLDETEFEIASIFAACVRAVRFESGREDVLVDLDTAEDAPRFLFADAVQFAEILRQMLRHAVETARPNASVKVEISRNAEGGFVVCVADDDYGALSPERMARAMMAFANERRPEGVETAAHGSMPMARALAQLHDGDLRLASRPDGSVCTQLTLPAWRSR